MTSPGGTTVEGREGSWHRVSSIDVPAAGRVRIVTVDGWSLALGERHIDALVDQGRVRTVVAGPKAIALTHYEGQYGALDNHCPHQGGPLGEGSIEKGLLRCPWHGYDYDRTQGRGAR